MVAPQLATVLCVIATDAAVTPARSRTRWRGR